jgi:hypothetical protein
MSINAEDRAVLEAFFDDSIKRGAIVDSVCLNGKIYTFSLLPCDDELAEVQAQARGEFSKLVKEHTGATIQPGEMLVKESLGQVLIIPDEVQPGENNRE